MNLLIKFAKNLALVITSLIIALLMIEGSAKLLLRFHFQLMRSDYIEQKNEIWSLEGARRNAHLTGRAAELSRVVLNWPKKDYPITVSRTAEDRDLFFEPSRYSHSEQGNSFYTEVNKIRPNMNDDFRLVGAHSGRLKYIAHYTTDSFGRRVGYTNKSKAPNLLFMGCSFTFGQGVNDHENFVYLTGLKTQSNSFNVSQPGSSPSIFYKLLKERGRDFLGPLPDGTTTAIFTIIPEHIIRVVGTISHFRTYPDGYKLDPYITLENDKLKIQKNFAEDPTGTKGILLQLSKWDFTQAFSIDYPRITDEHFKLISVLLEEIKNEVQKIHPHVTNFYVAFYPTGNARKVFLDLRDFIKNEGKLQILDYTSANFSGLLRYSAFLKYDGHPSPLAHDLLSEFLAHDLKNITNPDLFSGH